MPGRKWYAIALVVLVAGAAAAGVMVYTRLSDLSRELVQVIVPGEADVTFSQPGTYTIYFEAESVVNGRYYRTAGDIAGLLVRVRSTNGVEVDLASPSFSSNYSIAGRSGEAVLTGTIVEPGRYHLAAGYTDGRTEPQAVLAIGLGVPGKILSTILTALAIGACSFLAAVATVAVTFLKRRKAIRLATAPQPGIAPS
jgi:hypothetical protein